MRLLLLLSFLWLTTEPGLVSAQIAPDSLVQRAVICTSGEAALAAAPALEWKASAAVHLPDRDIRPYGHWQILPPHSAEERHQFYLYALLRLLPLQRARLRAVPADSSGAEGLRVEQLGRLPVFVYSAPCGQVTRLATRFATSDGTPGDSQDVYLSGSAAHSFATRSV